MDYFKQRRAYRNFKLMEENVSNGQNNLYRELLDYANDQGKLDGLFPVKNSALTSLTGLSEQGVVKARNQLVQLGLIEYIPGKKNKAAPQYQIIDLNKPRASNTTSNPTRNDKSVTTSRVTVEQPVVLPVEQPVSHKELNSTDPDLTNTNNNHNDGDSPLDFFEKNGFGVLNIYNIQKVNDWVNDFKQDGSSEAEAIVIKAMQLALDNNARNFSYANTILNKWSDKKLLTLSAIEASNAEFQSKKKQGYQRPIVQKDTLPDWAKKKQNAETTAPQAISKVSNESVEAKLAALRGRNSEEG